MRWLVALCLTVAAGCAEHTLERHLRVALDILTAEQAVHGVVRAACPDEATCPDTYAAQHDLVDAYDVFVGQLDLAADAGRWRKPHTADELAATCRALVVYRADLLVRGVVLHLPQRTLTACGISAEGE